MTFEEIKSLIQLINKSELAEFRFEEGDQKIVIRTSKFNAGKQQQVVYTSAPAAVAPAPIAAPAAVAAPIAPSVVEVPKPAAKAADTEGVNYLEIKSPIVGTFYRSAGPDKPTYAKVGDVVNKGSVVCIIEAMKLFNEIESEVKGKIVKLCVEDASPVEFDQVLFLVDPKG
ncbi:MAG: acetyl-CoA carboxylase biotin carboxyl carrier protein [Saprospiraceae bacterium]|nr:acetyl-CoA carboxylase biotin carboxyl carrier protein [Saprospiraceae bacterium]